MSSSELCNCDQSLKLQEKIERLETVRPVDDWIRVDKPPSHGNCVDVWVKTDQYGRRVADVYYLEDTGFRASLDHGEKITHWKPLPPPPNDKENKK